MADVPFEITDDKGRRYSATLSRSDVAALLRSEPFARVMSRPAGPLDGIWEHPGKASLVLREALGKLGWDMTPNEFADRFPPELASRSARTLLDAIAAVLNTPSMRPKRRTLVVAASAIVAASLPEMIRFPPVPVRIGEQPAGRGRR